MYLISFKQPLSLYRYTYAYGHHNRGIKTCNCRTAGTTILRPLQWGTARIPGGSREHVRLQRSTVSCRKRGGCNLELYWKCTRVACGTRNTSLAKNSGRGRGFIRSGSPSWKDKASDFMAQLSNLKTHTVLTVWVLEFTRPGNVLYKREPCHRCP